MTGPDRKPPGEHGRKLRREVAHLRRRARLQLLAKAFLAAVAADLLYDLAVIGAGYFTGRNIYFPPFFLVALAVFSVYALRATGMRTFSRRLDREHGLKSRLAAAEEYRRTGRVPPDVTEAQAKESLRSIDFPALRRSLRFRPAAHLALIAVFGGLLGFIVWRFPGLFQPGNFLYRQGSALLSRISHPPVEAPRLAAAGGGGEERGPDLNAGTPPGEERPKEAEEREKPEPGEPKADGREKPREAAEREKDPRREAERQQHAGDRRDERRDRKKASPPGGKPKGPGASDTAGGTAKVPSVEVTERPSPLTAKPRAGLAPENVRLDPRRTGAYLPPIPLFRLLAESRTGSLIDPETITIVPEAYDARYRRHIIAYFEKLKALRGGTDGS